MPPYACGRTIQRALASPAAVIAAIDAETACVLVQYPDVLGRIPDLARISAAAAAHGALVVAVVTEPVALGLIESPGTLGADIVVGEGQSLGVGLQFGGPYLGLFGCREKFVRQMPGRLCGETVDADGKRSFVLTLSTREQHIRREKATSNICTSQVLLAVIASMYAVFHGPRGLKAIAMRIHRDATRLANSETRSFLVTYDQYGHVLVVNAMVNHIPCFTKVDDPVSKRVIHVVNESWS